MRPSSRGTTASGQNLPPGTSSGEGALRPNSGRLRPPGTARLRTGMVSTGPGTQAAQGLALQAGVNLVDRPVTGQGMSGMKQQPANTGRLVEDNAYYIGNLRKRITDITNEVKKLRNEIDNNSKDTALFAQLEKKYESLIKTKESLEGQLADFNLALDKTRTSTDPEDVKLLSQRLKEKNARDGQELDRVFMLRKQKENETAEIEDKIEAQYRAVRNRIDSELEPGKRRIYNDLLNKQRELQERNLNIENKLNEINSQIVQIESDDKSSALRKEYTNLERMCQELRFDAENLQQELEIANMDPKEAHAKFVARVNNFKKLTKDAEDKIVILKDEIATDKKNWEDLNSSNVGEDTGDTAKYELLVKREQEMNGFFDSFDDNRNGMLMEQQKVKLIIVALLEHLSKGIEDSTNLPTQEALGEMEEAKTFKEKNLASAQRTMESLLAEKRKREGDLELLKQSEPKLLKELTTLRETMTKMKQEMKEFQDVDGLKRAFENTQYQLQELKSAYIKRRDNIRQQVQSLSFEHEALKKQLNANEISKDLDEIERRLKHNERTVFEIKDFVDSKSRETEYERVKGSCLKLTENLNALHIKSSQGTAVFGSQAKW